MTASSTQAYVEEVLGELKDDDASSRAWSEMLALLHHSPPPE